MLARVLLLLRIERCLEAEAAFDVAGFGDVVLAAELDRVEGARPRNRGQSNGFWIKIQVKQGGAPGGRTLNQRIKSPLLCH